MERQRCLVRGRANPCTESVNEDYPFGKSGQKSSKEQPNGRTPPLIELVEMCVGMQKARSPDRPIDRLRVRSGDRAGGLCACSVRGTRLRFCGRKARDQRLGLPRENGHICTNRNERGPGGEGAFGVGLHEGVHADGFARSATGSD